MVGIVALPSRDRVARRTFVYELRVLEEGAAVIGWASSSFFGFAAGHIGVGDDDKSLGFSIRRRAIMHNGEIVRPVPSVEVRKGDIIRCAFDTSSGTAYF